MFFIVLGQHVSILIGSSSGPSKTIEGPEDDSIRIKTYCPNTIKKRKKNIIKVCCVRLTHHCIFYIRVEHFGMANIKFDYD